MAHPDLPFLPGVPARLRAACVVVSCPSEIDLLNAATVRESLLTALGQDARWVIADMTGTRFCDAAGCRAVIVASGRARQLGARFQAVAPSPAVRRVFQLTGTDSLVDLRLTLAEAASSVLGPAGDPESGYQAGERGDRRSLGGEPGGLAAWLGQAPVPPPVQSGGVDGPRGSGSHHGGPAP
jgi:anti-sigma B factor antagonist